MGLIWELIKLASSHTSEKKSEKLDYYDLEPWEKELVKKGEYDPWSFDYEDFEEDDYYYEDEE